MKEEQKKYRIQYHGKWVMPVKENGYLRYDLFDNPHHVKPMIHDKAIIAINLLSEDNNINKEELIMVENKE